uniref:S-adenosylmethionine:tRNA ribosyltransferase-isomerase n=1 Tax=uncultured bacterium AB_162 TaxID=1630011 RepID=A0A0E3JNN5_9BACT|nr:S-adenosylmethionine:tRNA ribosyltransferase-isomerase [uncultured bacterium AB_162]
MEAAVDDRRRDSYGFDLPDERIARQPPEERGGKRSDARLLTVHRDRVEHGRFDDLPRHLRAGDAFVVNNARVVPSVLRGATSDGDEVAVQLFSPMEDGSWHCMVAPERVCRRGARLTFGAGALTGELRHEEDEHVWRLALEPPGAAGLEGLAEYLYPYYIETPPADPASYQTVYASRPGSTGLPSAGRHLTRELLDELGALGVKVVEVTLYIAVRGTYRGFCKRVWEIARPFPGAVPPHPWPAPDGPPQPERYEVTLAAADAINETRRGGGRIVVCGTSALRALETVADAGGRVYPGSGWTSILIAPGHRFRVADAFLTNLHMPMSSELLLTAAFVGSRERTLEIYRDEVLPRDYAFYEFGDSMLIAGQAPVS